MEIKNDGILRGYTTQATAYEVKDYPYGFRLRTSIFYWIESKEGHGDRLGTYTINPKTNRPNKPKYGTYETFLYLYLDSDTGHVKTGRVDSYNRDVFEGRFLFIVHRFGEMYLADAQKKNIRKNHLQHVIGNAVYEQAKYSEEKREEFKSWLGATVKHIKTCAFADLLEYPAAPEQDNPNGEYKMIIKERPTYVKPEPPTHSITAEKVEAILKRVLPGFYIECSEYNGMAGKYMQISAAASDKQINGVRGQYPQRISLSLLLDDLTLKVQQYGGTGGQWIYRKPNLEDPKEKYLAMKSEKIPFRTPPCNEKDVLSTIERFAVNYKKLLAELRPVLMYQDMVNYDELLQLNATA